MLTDTEIKESILTEMKTCLGIPEWPSLNDSLVNDLNMDSLDLIELIMSLEEHFELDVGDDQVDNWETVGDLVSRVTEVYRELQP